MKERTARRIYDGRSDEWKHLALERKNYLGSHPHEKIFILSREGHLMEEIQDSLHPEFL